MKECPKCHAKYADAMNFCTQDGCQLVECAGVRDGGGSGPARPKRKHGCLRKILIAVVVVVLGFIALCRHIMNAATYLRLEPERIAAAKGGGETDVDIDYDGYVWLINHKPEWVEVDEGDDRFTVEVKPNRTGEPREGAITIKSGKQLAQLAIAQRGEATYVKASETSVKFDKGGGYCGVGIETDGAGWTAVYPDWLDATAKENVLDINCPKNDGSYRSGKITVKEDDAYCTVYVTQSGVCPDCEGTGEKSCSFCGGSGRSGYWLYSDNCFWCGGSGKLQCGLCGGSGFKE